MRATGFTFAFPLLVVVAAAGCHAGASSGSASATEIPLASYCDAVAEQSCARFAPCCEQSGFAVDVGACRTQQRAVCAAGVQAHQQHGHVYDASSAGRCLASAGELYDGCIRRNDTFFASQRASEACALVWTGTAKVGGPCAEDADCRPQPGSRVGCGGTAGKTCIAVGTAPAGAACDTSGAIGTAVDCVAGTACTPLSVLPGGDAGAPGGAVCLAPAAVGGRCTSGVPSECQDGLWCDFRSGTCRFPGRDGDSCSGAPCATGLACHYPDQVCHGPSPIGATCGNDGECVSGGVCRSSVCTALEPNGASCSWSGACASGRCDFTSGRGTCVGDPSTAPPGFQTSVCTPLFGAPLTGGRRERGEQGLSGRQPGAASPLAAGAGAAFTPDTQQGSCLRGSGTGALSQQRAAGAWIPGRT